MRNLHFFDKIIYVFNAIAATVLLLSFILPFLPPKTFSLLSVLSLGVPFLTLVNVLFFLYWLLKLKRQLILSLVVVTIGYVSFGSLYKFSASKNIKHPENFKVMNYNVRLFNLYDWIPEKSVETKIIDFIKTESPDVLAIQEYHPNSNIDLSSFKYKFEKLAGKKIKNGQAIFSKFPIVNSGSIEFPNTSNNAIFADIVKKKDTIRVYNIHFESLRIDPRIENLNKEESERLFKRIEKTFEMQQLQTELFLIHKKQSTYKMIICGDFNNSAFSYVYRTIKGDLNDAFQEAGNGFGRTYDFKFFPVRIDFMFVDQAFEVNGFKTYNVFNSDHFPIMATLALKEE
ncbi:endonuclease/exonuclease/phosphatase family protein [Mariniflexile ostreae]|uniref:Endonuclease/exonuclease/phosphatase family protein n=1 Tax=Mariniflexile ostreae TaxID=1520892 RepID=A0ABV5FDD0_9FLAO